MSQSVWMFGSLRSALALLLPVAMMGCGSTTTSDRAPARKAAPDASPFAQLGGLQTYEDLSRYGLVAPGKHNHEAGSQLVLLALKVTSIGKGDWVMAHGLLGVTMLDAGVTERQGYSSLFLPYALGGWKVRASVNTNNSHLFMQTDYRPAKSVSIVARREAALYCIGYNLQSRYIYDDTGNYAHQPRPSPYPKTNARLRTCLALGLEVLRELGARGFEDRTLRDALGIGFASLDRDGAMRPTADVFALGLAQVFRDALDAALTSAHGEDVLEAIGFQMELRGLTVDDEMLAPQSQEGLDSLLTIVRDDLGVLSKSTASR